MKILHICRQDFGGAGIAAHRLHLGLKSSGVQSKMLVLRRISSDSDVVEFVQNNNIIMQQWNKLRAILISSEFNAYKDTRPQGLEIFTDDRSIYTVSKHPLVQESDVINLHWIARMVNYIEFFSNILNKPIVWTLHDMNPFTGGCHYAGDCTKYQIGCGACPQLGSKDQNDLSRRIFRRKEKAYKGNKIHIVTPSKWLADCARQSQLFKKFKVDVIPNGIPTVIFNKRNKQYSRELLSLPQDKILVLFGSHSVNTARKGAYYLKKVLMLLRNKVDDLNLALVVFGSNSSTFLKDVGFPVYQLGTIYDELLLSVCYSASDIFLLPSLEDNLPNTVLESMACGTPVVSFDIGGIPDMVRSGETGLLAKVRNSEELCEQIEWMVKHPEKREQMGQNAQKIIEQEYALAIQLKRYNKLYESIHKP